MPTYDYMCGKCEYEFEIKQRISDPPVKTCEKCGGEVTKLISSSTFVLKGGGWYADGYSSGKGGSEKPCGSNSASCGTCSA